MVQKPITSRTKIKNEVKQFTSKNDKTPSYLPVKLNRKTKSKQISNRQIKVIQTEFLKSNKTTYL